MRRGDYLLQQDTGILGGHGGESASSTKCEKEKCGIRFRLIEICLIAGDDDER